MEKKKVNNKNVKRTKKSSKQDYFVYECLSALIVTVILFIVSLLSLVGKDREYSENENRYLTTKPQFSWSSLMDGKFMDDATVIYTFFHCRHISKCFHSTSRFVRE